MSLLSETIWLPLIGALVVLAAGRSSARTARNIALIFSVLTFLVALGVLARFHGSSYRFQSVEQLPWIPPLGIQYFIGVDGISVWLLMLTSLLGIVAVAMSRYVEVRVHVFMALILALESFMLGAFCSLDLVLFFTFFELTLFPMYFLITLWGGERRVYAGTKFFIYTFAGSIFMLIGIVALAYRVPGGPSFDIVQIQQAVASGQLWAGETHIELLVFWSFAIAFLVKTPAFPLHTWMPVTYTDSPTVVPVLSGVMVKLGTFGLLRFCLPLFPDVLPGAVPILMALAVIGIIYGGVVAAAQKDMRSLIAYSSISHMGFILLGIMSLTYEGLVGAAYQQLNHSIIAAGLIVLLAFLYERRQTRLLSDYGGLKARMPIFATLFLLLMLASAGLPGTNGFVGEFLALLGAFTAGASKTNGLNLAYASLAAFGVVLSAGYLLYMFQRIFYGKIENPLNSRLKDLKAWEIAVVSVLIVFVLWGGLYPSTFLKPMEATLEKTQLMATQPEGSRPTWAAGPEVARR